MDMYRIAVVEDEKKINTLVTSYLEKEGYEVVSYYSGKEALDNTLKIDLWILDIMLGDDINGYDLIKEIKKDNSLVPVIFTSARDQDLDKIIGLELDADDYITKPYSLKELLLRVNKLTKRIYEKDFNVINYGDYRIDFNSRLIFEKETEIKLTTLEFELLNLLIKNKNIVFSREQIINSVWNVDYYGNDRIVDDLLRRLRQKMPKLNINTVYGYGYRLV